MTLLHHRRSHSFGERSFVDSNGDVAIIPPSFAVLAAAQLGLTLHKV